MIGPHVQYTTWIADFSFLYIQSQWWDRSLIISLRVTYANLFVQARYIINNACTYVITYSRSDRSHSSSSILYSYPIMHICIPLPFPDSEPLPSSKVYIRYACNHKLIKPIILNKPYKNFVKTKKSYLTMFNQRMAKQQEIIKLVHMKILTLFKRLFCNLFRVIYHIVFFF